MTILGIDIGGSGIKAAPVDITTGALLAERYRLDTPQPSKPKAVAMVVAELTRHFDWHGPIGATMPARIKNGVAHTAANIDKKWIGTNVAQLFAQTTGCPTRVLNDADAAGVAEMAFGAGRGRMGVVLMLTFGTGIGSGLFIDGILVPNTELGHLIFHGDKAEAYAAAARLQDPPAPAPGSSASANAADARTSPASPGRRACPGRGGVGSHFSAQHRTRGQGQPDRQAR